MQAWTNGRRPTTLAIAATIVMAWTVGVQGQAAPQLQDVEERSDPIPLAGYTFSVIRHYKRLPGKTGPDAETLASLEIVDATGRLRHQQTFGYSVDGGSFSETCSADVETLDGSNGKGFLIDVGCLPSAPLSGGPWEILSIADGKLVPLGKPMVAEGQVGDFAAGRISRIGNLTQILPDTLSVRIWTGYFFVTVPVRIGWLQGQLALSQRCFYQTGSGLAEEGCEMPVEQVERHPVDQELTFVRLFEEAHDPSTTPAHVVVRKDSRVDVLAGKVLVKWREGADAIDIGIGEDIWIKVRIDGREGWIHTDEDLNAIGLHFSG